VNRPFLVKSLGNDGISVNLAELDLCVLGASVDLPYDIEKYFQTGSGTFRLPLESLITTRARPRGIANAARLMREAYEGSHSRRAPVTVRPHTSGDFVVEDGNSTVLNAIASAWPDILCAVRASTDGRSDL
jgi:hypothetical protein